MGREGKYLPALHYLTLGKLNSINLLYWRVPYRSVSPYSRIFHFLGREEGREDRRIDNQTDRQPQGFGKLNVEVKKDIMKKVP